MKLSRALLLLLAAPVAFAAPDGADLYTKNCAVCHEALAVIQNHLTLKTMAPEYIVHVLDNGAMRLQAAKLTKDERAAIAEYLTGKSLPTTGAGEVGKCSSPAPKSLDGPAWNGWGADLENSRSQSAQAAGLTADQIPKLKLKWAFGFPGDYSAYSQPAIVGGRVFVGSIGGQVYSLDAKSGCTYWSFDAGASVRSAIMIGPGDVAYFGDVHANVYALDANTGKLIWKTSADDYPTARITAAPKLYEGRLYVAVASRDEWFAADPRFQCCKFRGSILALDAKTGKQIWKTYTISEPARPISKKGSTQLWGPSGVGVWTSPTIDTKRKVLYVGTGDSYSEPPTPLSDSILALDLNTGKIAWSRQLTEGDVFNGNCIQAKPINCPANVGPDSDFGSSPILRTLSSGRSVLIAGQKSGVVHALDPDDKGKILWQTRVGKGGMLGGIQWGPAADRDTAFVALSDLGLIPAPEGVIPDPKTGGGLFAIQLSTGEKLWSALPPEGGCQTPHCSPSQSAAVTVIPGVVFSGSLDGHLRAYSAKDGKILWDFDTARDFETVNGVSAKGGALDGPGPAVAGGILVVNSGYGFFNGMPGNVLLAFGIE